MQLFYEIIAAPILLGLCWVLSKLGRMNRRRNDDSEAIFSFFFKDR